MRGEIGRNVDEAAHMKAVFKHAHAKEPWACFKNAMESLWR